MNNNCHQPFSCDRRNFLRLGAGVAAGVSWDWLGTAESLSAAEGAEGKVSSPAKRSDAKVAVVSCRSYGSEVRGALSKAFDLLGGIGGLVKGKTVTVKVNLTGTNFIPVFDRPVGESYMTHFSTALTLGSLLFAAGAKRVRFVESTNSRANLETTMGLADWDVQALQALGDVEFENTRNLGKGKAYAELRVPTGGNLFSSFHLNHAYADTDVLVSLAKLKQHLTTGVTLSMKNLFGITPNALYGDEAGTEDALAGRGPLHSPAEFAKIELPGFKKGNSSTDPSYRVPRIVTDICTARPIHLAVIDGITAMSGGEGPWCGDATTLKLMSPGLLIAGLNPVSTDAVCTGLMGFANPSAGRGTAPFEDCDNHLLMAEQAGIGVADLAQIDVRGLSIEQARHPYPVRKRS
jgi:uncharacterized protein (DUF362 family)